MGAQAINALVSDFFQRAFHVSESFVSGLNRVCWVFYTTVI